MIKENKQHILRVPLPVYSGGPESRLGVLPAGACLRFVTGLDEGIDRYMVYLNVERAPLLLEDVDRPNYVDPLLAFPQPETGEGGSVLESGQLIQLLSSLGVSRADLLALLETGYGTHEGKTD